MYKLRPIVSHDETLPVPSHNMYRIKPIQEVAGQAQGHSGAATGSKGDMASLEGRQEDILKKLAKLKNDIEDLRIILRQPSQVTAASISSAGTCPPCPELGDSRDIVVYASPEFPPYSILGLARLWGASCPLELTNHTHSSVKEAPSCAGSFCNSVSGTPHLRITLVWKNVGAETELVINPVKYISVRGETNILRFLSRVGPSNLAYENTSDLIQITQLDEVLDNCQRLARSRTVKEKQAIVRGFNASLGKSDWMSGQSKVSIVDLAVWSVVKQLGSAAALTQTMTKWLERCDKIFQ